MNLEISARKRTALHLYRYNFIKGTRRLAAGLLALLVLLLFGAASSFAGETSETEGATRVVPFKLKTLDGKTFDSNRELKGRVSILAFWRLEQKKSMLLLEQLMELRAAFPENELNIVTILSGEIDPGKARTFVDEKGLTFPVLLEPTRNVYAAFGIIVSPTSWFIDADGNQRIAYAGYRRDFSNTAKAHVELLLGRISEEDHASRIEKKVAPRTSGTVDARVHYRFAKRHLENGDSEAYQDELRQAWKAEPRMAEAGVDLGLLLLQDGKLEEALPILMEAARLLPDDPRANGAKGLALIRSGETEEGAELLRSALKNGLEGALFFYEMGRISELQGDQNEALGFYRAGLELLLGSATEPMEAP